MRWGSQQHKISELLKEGPLTAREVSNRLNIKISRISIVLSQMKKASILKTKDKVYIPCKNSNSGWGNTYELTDKYREPSE